MPAWNIAAAQYGARPGDLRANISHHLDFIHRAAAEQIDLLIFPELSLTGYDLLQAASLALPFNDGLLCPLQEAAIAHQMTIIVGMPLRNGKTVATGFVSFLPEGSRVACCRTRRSDIAGKEHSAPLVSHHHRSIAISLNAASDEETGPHTAANSGADLYATGRFVNEISYQHDEMYLQRWAHKYRLPVLLANHAFSCGQYRTAGRSACWDAYGQLVVRADHGELLAIGRRDEKGWHGEVIPLR